MSDEQFILVAGLLLTAGLAASLISGRIRLPGLLLFLGIGMLIGTDALGWLECETRDQVDAGDHTFFVGEVRNAKRGRSGPPLVYLNQRYVSM